MSFRRPGKSLHANAEAWHDWKVQYADLLRDCGLPTSVLRSRTDWLYFLRYGYHCAGAYPNIDFNSRGMAPAQRASLNRLLELTLTKAEKKRGNAMWPACSDNPEV